MRLTQRLLHVHYRQWTGLPSCQIQNSKPETFSPSLLYIKFKPLAYEYDGIAMTMIKSHFMIQSSLRKGHFLWWS